MLQKVNIQNLAIPCAFVTGLSYAKSARTVADWRNNHRFQTLEAPEIALRVLITRATCMSINESFDAWSEVLSPSLASVKEAPTTFYLAGRPLYASALFAITSMTRTDTRDGLGELVAIEADFTLSGVSVSKEASRVQALSFDTDDLFPPVTISANGRNLPLGEGVVITALTVTERGCNLSCSFDDGSKVVSRDTLTDLQTAAAPTVTIGDDTFYIFYTDLVDDVLTLSASVFPVEWNRPTAWTKGINAPVTLSDIFPGWSDYTGTTINFVQCRESLIDLMRRLQNDLGFLIDYTGKAFRAIPSELAPTVDMDAFITEDSLTEPISGLTWCDGINSFFAGDRTGALLYHKASIRVDGNPAASLLRYSRLNQNTLAIEIPINPRIRQWSVLTVVKNGARIPAMVSSFTKDFFANTMRINLLY